MEESLSIKFAFLMIEMRFGYMDTVAHLVTWSNSNKGMIDCTDNDE